MLDERIRKLELFAWVGEDELGSDKVGLIPSGQIPLVATTREKAAQDDIVEQMQAQSIQFAKVIRLVRFTYEEVVVTLNPGR